MRIRSAIALILGMALTGGANAAITTVGNVTNVTLAVDTDNGNTNVTFWISNGGVVRVTPFAADVIRIRYYFTDLWSKEEPMIAKASNQWTAVSSTVTDQGSTYLISTPQLDVVVTKIPFKVDFKDKSGFYLLQDDHMEFDPAYGYTGQKGTGASKVKCFKTMPTGQSYFGLGEYGGQLNRRGLELECWSVGTYNWGEAQNPEYMNLPFFYGVQPTNTSTHTPAFVYGVFFNNPCRPLFSFGGAASGSGKYSFQAGDGQMDYFFFGGGLNHTMAGVIDRYSELTGRPTMLPKWAFGHQLSRFSYMNTAWVEYIAQTATASNIPLDAVYLDIDYMQYGNLGDGNIRQLTFNSGSYSDPISMANSCSVYNVKLVPLVEPWLEPNDTTLYNDANANHHFVRDNTSNTVVRSIYVGNVSWFDYTSSAATNWWATKVSSWTFPWSGLWNDLTEPEGGDSIPYNGLLYNDNRYGFDASDSRNYWSNEHNYFGLRSTAMSYAAFRQKYPTKRPFVLSRSGTSGLQRYGISWSGDTRANWTYARTCIRFGTSAMISGAGWYGHDLGGFAGTVDGELMTRWYEWGALLPLYRSHSEKGSNVYPDGNQGREPWRFTTGNGFSQDYVNLMRNNIQFRYKLMPYLYTLAYNATQNGQPMNTPAAFQFYSDNNTTNLNDYEFMCGDNLFAAPVYTQGATTRQVYLPYAPGLSWYYYPDNTKYNGGQTITVNAPLGTLPLFVRSGAIIPMGPSMQYVNQFNPGYLDLHCWPDGNSSFTLYEDAGEGWDYTNSAGRVLTTFTSVRGATNWDFNIAARQGGYNPVRSNYFVYAFNPQVVSSVTLNGSPLSSNSFSSAAQCWLMTGGKLGIKITDDGTAKSIHVDWSGTNSSGGPVANEMGLPGTWSTPVWDDVNSPWAMTRVEPPGTPAGATWYTNAIYVNGAGGDITAGTYQFKLRANHNWGTNWGFNAAGSVNINGTTTLAPNGSTNCAITVLNGSYYSVRALSPTPGANATIAVLKTSGQPVTPSLAGISPAFPKPGDAVTALITLSAAKSTEENVYLRWTTNNWTTCDFALATGSGTNYTATLPAMPLGTTVKYYLLTTTATMNSGTCGNADALTLALDTNRGLNYTYTPSPIPWPGVGYPSDPAINIHHWKEEAIVGNGYITAMLDQNGTLYDLYFPSVGAAAGTATANEGYHADTGPQWPPGCTQNDSEANGQMNVVAAMGGIAITNGANNTVYWLNNASGTNYTEAGQRWVSEDTDVTVTSNQLNVAGYNIQVQQYDFVPSENAIPVNSVTGARSDGVRTNRAVYIKRFLLTNHEVTSKTINFYWDANFNVKGDDAYDQMSFEGTVGGTNYNAMIVADNAGRLASGNWCSPNGYGGTADTEYDPSGAGNWSKSNSVYFATVMKLVTNSVTGAGSPCDGSWRDYTTTDNQEGWIGKTITIAAGQTVEVDVMTVGSWDTFAGATGTHTYWGRPLINWFYSNNMSNVQAVTEGDWSNWLNSGVTVSLPDDTYGRLFKRSLIVSKLHCDPVGGAVIAGMHNGAYPFVWPRDGVYAAVTFDRTGHSDESTAFYKWLNNAQRPTETWGGGYFFQKYTTDGKPVWRSPQVDETASVPWGLYYHYLATGDGTFLSNNWSLAYTAARASSENGTNDTANLNYDAGTHLMWSWNVWEDVLNEHLYSNGSVVRGLQDAANIGDIVGSNSWANTFRARASDIRNNGIVPRINAKVEPSDVSHLGLVVPFEVFTPNDPLMTNVVEWLHGRQSAGGFTDSIVEDTPDTAGLVRRYNHKLGGEADIYWNGGPWTLASAWYGEYFARWQDYVGGKSMIDTNKVLLDQIISKLGPMGLAGEQIAVNTSEQKYPDFWLQTAWPNTWESHTTLLDQMMMFLDYRPQATNNTCYFAPKLPSAWTTMGFSNLLFQAQRFDVGVSEHIGNVRLDLNKRTTGALNVDLYLRIPPGNVPTLIVTNGTPYTPNDYDTVTGRVHIQGPLKTAAGNNALVVYYGTTDSVGDGLPDWWRILYFDASGTGTTTNDQSCDTCDPDGDGMNNWAEYLAGTIPTDGTSSLRIVNIRALSNGDTELTWASVSNKNYEVWATPDFSQPFTALPGTVTALSATSSYTNSPAGGANFYKVKVLP